MPCHIIDAIFATPLIDAAFLSITLAIVDFQRRFFDADVCLSMPLRHYAITMLLYTLLLFADYAMPCHYAAAMLPLLLSMLHDSCCHSRHMPFIDTHYCLRLFEILRYYAAIICRQPLLLDGC